MLKRRAKPEAATPTAAPSQNPTAAPSDISQEPSMLRPRDVATLLSVTMPTLRAWRRAGKGPNSLRVSVAVTRYPRDQLLSWLKEKAAGNVN